MRRAILFAVMTLLFGGMTACGGEAEVGEGCGETGIQEGECVAGGICGDPGDGSGELSCLKVCVDQADCAADQECNGVSGGSTKGCRPKAK